MSKHINDEERFFVRLLILVLALLFFEEELRDVKQKIRLWGSSILCVMKKFTINKKGHSISTKDPHPSSIIPIMIFLPPEGKALPFWAGCGRGGIRTPDTVVRSHVL